MNTTVLALMICVAAAALEGALTGSGVRQRLAQLRMPAYSPPFALWLVIGFLFYAMCFVILRRLLGSSGNSASHRLASLLLIFVLLANALWNVLFFRWRDLRASFLAFIPYAALVAACVVFVARAYPLGAIFLSCYGIYLVYAINWGYHLWRLNAPNV
jgi:tryptophan-rich sensory protein